jgi:guanine deaminase
MTALLIRGRLLSFIRRPQDAEDHACYRYEEDGGLLIQEGRITAFGDYATVSSKVGPEITRVDHRPHLILPGFIDPHIHFPQMQVIASFGTELLEWLNRYTFPVEAKFADRTHCVRIAKAFLDTLLRFGTTTAAVYCTVHPQSAEALFAEALTRNMAIVAGKVMMDRNAPAYLVDTAQSAYDDSKALIARWHGKGRLGYAITPRFAITSSDPQMEAAGTLAAEHPDCHVQTHLSENAAEVALALKLYPWAKDYTQIYEHYGLLGRKSLFGHCIHLAEREADALAESGSVAVFCPTSNLFLGSGLFDYQRLCSRPKALRIAVATDVGGGTSYSMLKTMDEAYKVVALRGEKLDPLTAFWQMTRGNAEALSMQTQIGTLDEGSDADIVVLDARATPCMALRMETVETLAEELFLLQTLGDDRAIAETYVAGSPRKSGSGMETKGRL